MSITKKILKSQIIQAQELLKKNNIKVSNNSENCLAMMRRSNQLKTMRDNHHYMNQVFWQDEELEKAAIDCINEKYIKSRRLDAYYQFINPTEYTINIIINLIIERYIETKIISKYWLAKPYVANNIQKIIDGINVVDIIE